MKTKKIYLALPFLGFILWSCTSQNEASSNSLKTSINSSAQSLTTAMTSIKSTTGYQLLNVSGTSSSSSVSANMVKTPVSAFDSTYSSILLTDISGIYDYKAANYRKWSPALLRFFVKTADNSDMIVRLPESKVKNPWDLMRYSSSDTTLVNNYVIDVSKYAYSFNRYLGWNYNLASNISVRGTSVGDLTIQSSNNKTNGYHFTSGFAFANGYTATASYTSGDTITSIYNISKASQTLYEEKYTAIKTSSTSKHRETEYSLTIGNVQVVREGGPNSLDSAKVYVDGVLQLHSKVKFIDVTSTSSSADSTETTITNHKRELQITFDDGTSTTINALLGSTISDIDTLFTAIRQTYFATNIVDYIAWDLYINKQ